MRKKRKGKKMSTEELKELFVILGKRGKMAFLEKAAPEQIELFEKKNGITLPVQYKEWLRLSDGGELYLPAGIQLYGVAHSPLIDIEDQNKPNDNYIVIGSLSSGDPIVCQKGGEQICIYNSEASRIESDEIYSDFISFLKDLKGILGVED